MIEIKIPSESKTNAAENKFEVTPRSLGELDLAPLHPAQLPAERSGKPDRACGIRPSYTPRPERWGLNE